MNGEVERIKRLILVASRAPSPDNNQPWLLEYDQERLEIYYNEKARIADDPSDILNYLAIGALIENLRLASGQEGLEAHVDFSPAARPGKLAATVNFVPGGKADPLAQYITERQTNRRLYSTRPPDDHVLQEMRRAAESSGYELLALTDRRAIKKAASALCVFDRMRMSYQEFHGHLYSCLRFSRKEAAERGDGLPIDTLELPPMGGLLLKIAKSWKAQRVLNALGYASIVQMQMYRTMLRSGALVVLAAPGFDDGAPLSVACMQGGKILERCWLTAVRHDMQFHPMGALPVFNNLLRGADFFSKSDRRLIERSLDTLRSVFGFSINSLPLMTFRLGYAKPARAGTPRYNLDRILQIIDRRESEKSPASPGAFEDTCRD